MAVFIGILVMVLLGIAAGLSPGAAGVLGVLGGLIGSTMYEDK